MNPIRKATFRANVNDVLTDIYIRTSTDNVTVDKQGTLLSDYLSNVVIQSDMRAALQSLKAELIDGAPEVYDTFKELSEYIKDDKALAESIQEALGSKASAVEVEEMKQVLGDLSNAIGSLSSDVSSSERIYYSETQPSSLKSGDTWIQPVSDASVLKSLE